MKEVETFEANIYMGLRQSYDGDMYHIEVVKQICQEYCDRIGFGLTVTPTTFVYTDGNEDGAIVGFINYPRFPSSKEEILDKAIELGYVLLERLKQERISIVTTDKTIMLEAEES